MPDHRHPGKKNANRINEKNKKLTKVKLPETMSLIINFVKTIENGKDMPYINYMPMLGATVVNNAHQIWLRKAATMLAVFACLLIGTIGGDVLALCVGEGHVAVELAPASKAPPAAAGISSTSGKNCVDAALLSSARAERVVSNIQNLGSKSVLLAAVAPSYPPSPDAAAIIDRQLAQVGVNPALKHHRTVVLLN